MEQDNTKLYKLKEEARKRNQALYREHVKKRLLDFVAKRFQTTMIGSLAKFENYFGHLWGHGKTSLTKEERKFREIWEIVRNEILTQGNNQLRSTQQEIAQYNLTKNMYSFQFINKRNSNEQR